jgi:pimeloyl-ACP methyl ester carboxylesterase
MISGDSLSDLSLLFRPLRSRVPGSKGDARLRETGKRPSPDPAGVGGLRPARLRQQISAVWIVNLAILLAFACAALVVLAYSMQTWMVFPTYLAGGASDELPAGAARFPITTPDGERLAAVRLPAADRGGASRPLVLGFGGNAWNAEAMAVLLHTLLPDHDVVVAHYRGYRPSTGRPSATKIMADAVTVHDRVATPPGVIAVGLSIGSGVAAHLAAERPLAGLVLVTPFDSLAALARHHYPWAPVWLLLRHRIETAELLRRVDAPTAVITAERDAIVPTNRSQPAIEAAQHLVYRAVIPGAGHNDLYDIPEFAAAMRQAIDHVEATTS